MLFFCFKLTLHQGCLYVCDEQSNWFSPVHMHPILCSTLRERVDRSEQDVPQLLGGKRERVRAADRGLLGSLCSSEHMSALVVSSLLEMVLLQFLFILCFSSSFFSLSPSGGTYVCPAACAGWADPEMPAATVPPFHTEDREWRGDVHMAK